jgi:spermidine synthase
MAREDSRLLGALFLSGVAALGYELLWTRLLGLALGHEFLGVLAALAGFFGGLAIGAAAFHARVRRAKDPAALFAKLELVAASYAAISPFVLRWLSDWVPSLLGPSIAGAGAGPLLGSLLIATAVLLPATVCMGATLPALVEARRRKVADDPDGRGLARLYGANTFGAVVGTVVAVHFLLPQFGLVGGAVVLALFGLGGAALAWRWAKTNPKLEPRNDDPLASIDTSKDPDNGVAKERWLLYVLVFGTGATGIGLEVVGVRVLSQAMSNTVYTFADILAVYLLGTAAGAWIYQRQAARAVAGSPARVTAALLLAAALSVVVSAAFLRSAPGMLQGIGGTDPSFGARALSEAIVAAAAFAIPTVIMGALLSHLLGLLAGRGIGRAYALNTLGSALAPFVLGLWAIPALGLTDAFFALSWAYLVLLVGFCWFRRFSTAWQLGSMIAVLGATVLGRGSLVLVQPPEGWTELERHEGVLGVVTVSEKKVDGGPPLRRLQVDQQFRMGGALSIGERRMGHIPLLLHGEPKHALFLGLGTGATAGASLAHPVESVDVVELVPEVLETLPHFQDVNGRLYEDDRVTIHTGDARRWLAGSEQTWDVVVADLFHPGRDGAGFLYSREHFERVREHLAEGGLFAQWLPLHQLDPETLRSIVATFVDVFPETHSWLALYNVESPALGLLGRTGETPLSVDLAGLVEQTRDAAFAPVVLQDPRDLFAAYMLDHEALVRLSEGAALNTDLRPTVLFDAPKSGQARLGATNLEVLAEYVTPYPEGLVSGDAGFGDFRGQTSAFAIALGFYLRAETILADKGTPGEPMPQTAVEAYVNAYRTAPEFAPPRGRLRQQIEMLAKSGFETEARALVERLESDVAN